MAKLSFLTAKSETGFKSFVLVICHWISGMQSTQNHTRITTWLPYISIYNLQPFEKDRKNELAGRWLPDIFSENKEDPISIAKNLFSMQRNVLFLKKYLYR